jgi:hypothetical protein
MYKLATGLLFLVPLLLPALPVTFTGSSGARAASSKFDAVGTNLVVTLTNTSSADPEGPADILTAVFFSITGSNPTLTTSSAVLAAGSTVKANGGATDAGGVVGGEWAYKAGISAHGANRGISSSGLGLFAPSDRFSGTNLQGPDEPNGVQYGITTSSDAAANDNGGISSEGLIKNSVIFTLGGLSAGFDPSVAITSVVFQYGTALTEPTVAGIRSTSAVPEPTSVVLLATLLAFTGVQVRRKVARS